MSNLVGIWRPQHRALPSAQQLCRLSTAPPVVRPHQQTKISVHSGMDPKREPIRRQWSLVISFIPLEQFYSRWTNSIAFKRVRTKDCTRIRAAIQPLHIEVRTAEVRQIITLILLLRSETLWLQTANSSWHPSRRLLLIFLSLIQRSP